MRKLIPHPENGAWTVGLWEREYVMMILVI
jgi:hypothetical protein